MALQRVGKVLFGDPGVVSSIVGADGNSGHQLNTTQTKMAFLTTVPSMEVNTITSVGVGFSAIGGTPTAITAGIYNVNADGTPNLTSPYGGMTTGTIATPAVGWFDVTLGTPATATPGDMVAIVFSQSFTSGMSATVNAWPNGRISDSPCEIAYSGTTWSKVGRGFPLGVALGYSGVYPNINAYPTVGSQGTTGYYGTGFNPNEFGLQFTPTVKLTVTGGWFASLQPATDSDSKLCLYQGTTLLTSATLLGTMQDLGVRPRELDFPSPQTLTVGTTYTLSLLPVGANLIRLQWTPVPTGINCWDSYGIPPTWSPSCVSRHGAAWSTVADKIPTIGPIVSHFDDGAGGGGGGGAAGSRIFGGF